MSPVVCSVSKIEPPDIKLLKFHANQNNSAYLEKCDFQQKLVFQFWDRYWVHGIKTSLGEVSDPDSESRLALHAKQDKDLIINFTDSRKA